MKNHSLKVLAVCAGLTFGTGAIAAVGADQAAKLGKELTALGAEMGASADGTIPAWDGGVTSPPAGYKVGDFHPDPFAADKPVLQITPANYKEHADKLTEGQQAMFAKYPSFRMDIYPTRRSAAFPERTYEYTIKNATTAKLINDGDGVTDAAEGIPFPIPQSGAEVIWNHKMKYKGISAARWTNLAPVTAGGQYNLVRIREEFMGLYYKPGNTIADINNMLLYFYQSVESPARLAGQVLLVHESLNQAVQPRQAWVYNPGQRRVRRAPNVAYDNPGTAADGLRTSDMTDMYNGALDRFDFKLVGKKDMYVPYNSYKAHSDKSKVSDMIKPGHIDPDYLRYELHRVWVVDATLKPGKRHINSRRTFYVDEDSWQILIMDHYNGQGALWRYSEAPSITYYEVPVFWTTMENHHDLLSGRYLATGVDNQDQAPDFSYQSSLENFTPQALRTRGVR
ncbi:DUF1329 domain-containing protein [Chiayiivirga flava]|uniref:DUF1329 domain-containing protein n=1 Tax=Chiayiivirga flava TaxID=659595 RepID=A0A7W8D470_9GAMM|nr:DUF1329 domain-containing protein [Chiayiivirga flava]MBB5207589.1 hypothetical protein [Chiayiivirga flava]